MTAHRSSTEFRGYRRSGYLFDRSTSRVIRGRFRAEAEKNLAVSPVSARDRVSGIRSNKSEDRRKEETKRRRNHHQPPRRIHLSRREFCPNKRGHLSRNSCRRSLRVPSARIERGVVCAYAESTGCAANSAHIPTSERSSLSVRPFQTIRYRPPKKLPTLPAHGR